MDQWRFLINKNYINEWIHNFELTSNPNICFDRGLRWFFFYDLVRQLSAIDWKAEIHWPSIFHQPIDQQMVLDSLINKVRNESPEATIGKQHYNYCYYYLSFIQTTLRKTRKENGRNKKRIWNMVKGFFLSRTPKLNT